MTQARKERIGIDIGNVISTHDTDTPGVQRITLVEMPHAAQVIARIAEDFKPENVFLVSKCGPKVQIRTRRWLQETRFCERAGIDPLHVIFCIHRKDKARIADELKLTHFIDDRLEVLSYMVNAVKRLIAFNPTENEKRQFLHVLPHVREVIDWIDVEGIILG